MPNPLENLQQFNIAGNAQNALMQGMQVGDAIRQRREAEARQKATDEAYRGIMTGDKSGINALAALPGGAKDAYAINNTLTERQVRADVASGAAPATALAAINWDDFVKYDDQQRKVAIDNAKTIGQIALFADTPEKWDQQVANLGPGFEQYKGQFGLREAVIARSGQMVQHLENQRPQYMTPASDEDLVNIKDPAALAAFQASRAGRGPVSPPPPGFELDEGGPTPPASATF